MSHKHKIKDDVRTDDLPADTFRNVPAAKPPAPEGAREVSASEIAFAAQTGPAPDAVTATLSPAEETGASRDPNQNHSLCSMTEVRYLFSQEVRRLRLEHGYEDVYALSRACARLPLGDLMKLETGLFEGFSSIIALSRFYGKKVRIVFY